jgi:hypothetical protein
MVGALAAADTLNCAAPLGSGLETNAGVVDGPRRRLPAGAVVGGGHRFARWRRAGMNSRLDRMDWASVESSRKRIPLCAHEMAPGRAIR